MTRYILCSIHNAEMVEKESKTKKDSDGKPVKYFMHISGGKVCFGANDDTKQTPQERDDEPEQAALPTATDWDLVGTQKTRCALAAAFISSGTLVPLTSELESELDKYVTWVLKPK